MKKIIKLSEQDLEKIVAKVLLEQTEDINPKKLKFGDRGKDVVVLQQILMNKGFLKTKTMKPTGYFGPLTKKALENETGIKKNTKEKKKKKKKKQNNNKTKKQKTQKKKKKL